MLISVEDLLQCRVNRAFGFGFACSGGKCAHDICSGYSWLQIYSINAAAHNVADGNIRIFGIGRNALAYPDFAVDIAEKGELDEIRVCKTLTYCTFLMRNKNNSLGQFPTGCPPFDKMMYGPIMKEAREAFRVMNKK